MSRWGYRKAYRRGWRVRHAPLCPTCGRERTHPALPAVHRPHRTFATAKTGRRPIRLYKVKRVQRSTMFWSRTYTHCNDPFHDPVVEPEAPIEIPKATDHRKLRAKRHKANQSKAKR